MSISGYITTFVSIIIGLALADVLKSLHRLLRAHSQVTWYWIPPALVILVLLGALNFWWGIYFWITGLKTISMLQFLPVLLQLVTFFLFVASVLPDEVPKGLNLKQWYYDNATYIWCLFAILVLLITAWLSPGRLKSIDSTLRFIKDEWFNEITIVGAIALACFKKPWLHSAYVVAAIAGAAWAVTVTI